MTQEGERSFEHTVVGIVSFTVPPDRLDAWRERWEAIARQAEATEGCQYFRLAQNTREANGYAIITAWHPGNTWLAFIQAVPELKEAQSSIWSSPFSFYVLMEAGKPLQWQSG